MAAIVGLLWIQAWHLWKHCQGKKFRVHTRKLLLWLTKCYSRFGPWPLGLASEERMHPFLYLSKERMDCSNHWPWMFRTKVAFGGEAACSQQTVCKYFADISSGHRQARELKRSGAATDLAKRGGSKRVACSLIHGHCERLILPFIFHASHNFKIIIDGHFWYLCHMPQGLSSQSLRVPPSRHRISLGSFPNHVLDVLAPATWSSWKGVCWFFMD